MIILLAAAFLFSMAVSLTVRDRKSPEYFIRVLLFFAVCSSLVFSGVVLEKKEILIIPAVLLIDSESSKNYRKYSDLLQEIFGPENVFFSDKDSFAEYSYSWPEYTAGGSISARTLFRLALKKGVFRGKVFVAAEEFTLSGFTGALLQNAESLVFLVGAKSKNTDLTVTGGTRVMRPGDTAEVRINLVNSETACTETLTVSKDGKEIEKLFFDLSPHQSISLIYFFTEKDDGNHRMTFSTATDSDYFDYSAGFYAIPALVYSSEPDWPIASVRRLLTGNSGVEVSLHVEGIDGVSLVLEKGQERTVYGAFDRMGYTIVFWLSESDPMRGDADWRRDCVIFWLVKGDDVVQYKEKLQISFSEIGKKHGLTAGLDIRELKTSSVLSDIANQTVLLNTANGGVLALEMRRGVPVVRIPASSFAQWYFSGGSERETAQSIIDKAVSWAESRKGVFQKISIPKKKYFTDEAVSFWVISDQEPEVRIDGESIGNSGFDGLAYYYFLSSVKEGIHLIEASGSLGSESLYFTAENRIIPESAVSLLDNALAQDIDSFVNSSERMQKTKLIILRKSSFHDFFLAALMICSLAVAAQYFAERNRRK
ncbi:hypothetical protein JW890_03520 [candidate division WOR-3 bacterium]|nr:hypothetical protein [candidate division WOR-3 bacterium]